jgi:hypothetical protein
MARPGRKKVYTTGTYLERIRVPEELMNLCRASIVREVKLHKKPVEEWTYEDVNEADSIADSWNTARGWLFDVFMDQVFGYKDET